MSEASAPRRSALPWLVAALIAVALGGVVTMALRGQKKASPTYAIQRVGDAWKPMPGEFAGAESCRECHRDIYDRQMRTAHAESLRTLANNTPRSPFGSGQAVTDPDTGAKYEMTLDGKKPTLSVKWKGLEASQEVHFEFGSGKRAFAYLAELGPNQYLDSRLNYYSGIKQWDFTSGQQDSSPSLMRQPLGRELGSDDAAMCFWCHTTVLHARGPAMDSAPPRGVQVDAGKTILGVTCERCHGPRAEHVRDFKSGKIPPKPEPWTATGQNEMCGQCHSVPNVSAGHKAVARFQPFGLSQSQCFIQSKGKLSCSTCHDPHEDAKRDDAYYVGRCLSCHSRQATEPQAVTARICPVNATTGCVSCHMARDSKSMLHATFVDHNIRILKENGKGKPGTNSHTDANAPGAAIRAAFAR